MSCWPNRPSSVWKRYLNGSRQVCLFHSVRVHRESSLSTQTEQVGRHCWDLRLRRAEIKGTLQNVYYLPFLGAYEASRAKVAVPSAPPIAGRAPTGVSWTFVLLEEFTENPNSSCPEMMRRWLDAHRLSFRRMDMCTCSLLSRYTAEQYCKVTAIIEELFTRSLSSHSASGTQKEFTLPPSTKKKKKTAAKSN